MMSEKKICLSRKVFFHSNCERPYPVHAVLVQLPLADQGGEGMLYYKEPEPKTGEPAMWEYFSTDSILPII